MRFLSRLTIVVALGVSGPALAQDWNAQFGGIPNGDLITGDIGYSAVPKVGYHHALSQDLSIGGAFAFDLGYYRPQAGTVFGLSLTAPVRIAIANGGAWSTAVKLEPGFLFSFTGGFGLNLLLNAGFNAGYRVNNQFIIGPGIDVPLALHLVEGFAFVMPILIGGSLEFHARPDLALTFDLKFGPWIFASDLGSGANFGLKVAAGVAYKF